MQRCFTVYYHLLQRQDVSFEDYSAVLMLIRLPWRVTRGKVLCKMEEEAHGG